MKSANDEKPTEDRERKIARMMVSAAIRHVRSQLATDTEDTHETDTEGEP